MVHNPTESQKLKILEMKVYFYIFETFNLYIMTRAQRMGSIKSTTNGITKRNGSSIPFYLSIYTN